MSDRELLELAARAAGMHVLPLPWPKEDGWFYCLHHDRPAMHYRLHEHRSIKEVWMPLTDDGDALRLAVKLELTILPGGGDVEVVAYENERDEGGGTLSYPVAMEETTGDKFSATRRAIVRAAAEIGKASTTDTAQQGGV